MCSSSNSSSSTNSVALNNSIGAAHALEDVQYLLYLETLRRFREDEANIKRQVDEKARQYLDVKEEYLQLYMQYTELIMGAATRSTQAEENPLHSVKVATAKAEVARIAEKLATDDVVEMLSDDAVAECKQRLSSVQPHEKLQRLQHELAENRANVRAVQAATEAVETTIETAALQGLDYFVDEMRPTEL